MPAVIIMVIKFALKILKNIFASDEAQRDFWKPSNDLFYYA